jgi:hypothetical protein
LNKVIAAQPGVKRAPVLEAMAFERLKYTFAEFGLKIPSHMNTSIAIYTPALACMSVDTSQFSSVASSGDVFWAMLNHYKARGALVKNWDSLANKVEE